MGLLGWGGTGKEPAMHHRSHGRCSVVSLPACAFALQPNPTLPPSGGGCQGGASQDLTLRPNPTRPPQVEAAKEARLKTYDPDPNPKT